MGRMLRVSNDLGERTTASVETSVPTARRIRRTAWKDPRLWIGVVLVCLSVVAGARLLAAVDDSIEVWAAQGDLVEGSMPARADLVGVRVRFANSEAADRYLLVADGLPTGRLSRSVSGQELLPVSAFDTAVAADLTTISVPVPTSQVPGSVRAGSVVDVWLVPGPTGEVGQERARRVFEGVQVVEAPGLAEGLGALAGERQIVLGIAMLSSTEEEIIDLVEAASQGRVLISGRSRS